MPGCTVSIVLCTWNRARLLAGALHALVIQQRPPGHEILVVDNGSTDETPAVVARFARMAPHVRYLLQPERGLAHARNAGVRAAAAPIVAFTDDDVRVGPGWVHGIAEAFATYPEAACVGGPVLPVWHGAAPAWLNERHWAALGLQDYGELPLRVDASRPLCLIGANLAFRRGALDRVGGFDRHLQRVSEAGGTTEDHDYHLRLWRAGLHGVYVPALRASAVVEPSRLRKRHHRQWHYGHGRHLARMRLPELEGSRLRVCGVPAHILRQAGRDVRGLAAGLARRDAGAFACETRLWFALGFLRERWS